jgi:nitrogen regulatory protein PII
MGITLDTEKEMLLSITDEGTAEAVMAAVKEKAGIKTPAHSLCFTIPVDKTVGLRAYETQEEE